MKTENYSIPSHARIGHVHLKVSDLDRSLAFYCDLLGFGLVTTYGDGAAFVSAGGYHHHIGLNTWYSKNADPPPQRHTGLFHVAILYPSRRDLAVILQRLNDADYSVSGASDHGVSEAIYLNDPDNNGIELYCDRDRASWPKKADGSPDIYTRPLDLAGLLAELHKPASPEVER